MAKKNYDERIDDLKRKEEELKAERARIEVEKREHEKRERTKRLYEMGRVAESYGLDPAKFEAMLEHITGSHQGVAMLEALGVTSTKKWQSEVSTHRLNGSESSDSNPGEGRNTDVETDG